jgi:tryptophan-rich sensory protein
VILCSGVGAMFYSYAVSRPMWYARPTDAIRPVSFPAMWGILFIGIAIHDLIMLLEKTGRGIRLVVPDDP